MLSAATNGRRLCGRYTLIERLGAGGQGEVWRARDESRGFDLALKVLSPSLVRSEAAWMALEREYEVANKLDHPSILKVHPPQRDAETAVLPMEIATGGDLRRLRGTSYLEIVPVLIEIAQALEHAHDRAIVHRDLKPSNVLFDSRGRVRLADFGVAAGTALSSQRDAIRSGMSPFTASPEQLRGEPPAISDDVYGLGALAYELLSGYPPYYPKFDLKRVLEEPVPEIRPVHQAPPRLLGLVMAMLAKRPNLRPHTMQDVLDDLDATLNDTLTFDFDEESAQSENADVDDSPPAVLADDDEDEEFFEPITPQPRAVVPPPSAPPASTTSPAQPTPAAPPPSASPRTSVPDRAARDPAATQPTRAPAPAPSRSPAGSAAAARASLDAQQAAIAAERAALERAAAALSAGPTFSMEAAAGVGSLDDTLTSAQRSGGDRRQRREGSISDRGSSDRSSYSRTASEPSASAFDVSSDIQSNSPSFGASTFDNIKVGNVPSLMRLEKERPRRWPYALIVFVLGAAAVTVFYWLPQFAEKNVRFETPPVADAPTDSTQPAPSTPDSIRNPPSDSSGAPSVAQSADDAAPLDNRPTENVTAPEAAPATAETDVVGKMNQARADFDQKLAALDAREAGVWGGKEYSDAKARSAEAKGARDAGDPPLAVTRLQEGISLLNAVESRVPAALATQLAAGDRAMELGNASAATQAYQLATQIDPRDTKAREGLRRAQNLDRVLPLLADAANAESAKNFTRAAKAYNDVLALEPNNARARAGITRTSSASGADSYEKAIGTGFAALSAGRLDEARSAFGQALAIRKNGREAADGLNRVTAAQNARGYSAVRLRATTLETEERWGEALDEYEAVLRNDASLVFAQQGRQRAAMRKDLSDRLQFLIDDPQRLAAPAVRSEALRLLDLADAQNPAGPVLRSQAARLQILLPEFDKPVRLALESDNTTQVAIQRVGSFGTFSRREIELKPGRYTVVGTRAGYRDVRRDVTIAPGQDVQIISVRCLEPI